MARKNVDARTPRRPTSPKPLAEGHINTTFKVRDVEEHDVQRLTWFGTLNDFRNQIRDNFKAHLDGRRRYLIADLQGFPVGQTVVSFERPVDMPEDDGETAYLYAVRVLPMLSGMGIGVALMQAAEKVAIGQGCRHVRLTVQVANIRAQKMYERLGYETVGTVNLELSFDDTSGLVKKLEEKAFVMQRSIARQKE